MMEVNAEGREQAELESAEFLDIIAASEQLGLVDAPTEEHRSAVVDIHAYLRLLENLTNLPMDELKRRLGCRRDVGRLPACELDELRTSQAFLALASELAFAAERQSPEVARAAVDLAARAFRGAEHRTRLVRDAVTTERWGPTPLRLVAEGKVEEAAEAVEAFLQLGWLERTTASGEKLYVERDSLRRLATFIVGGGLEGSASSTRT